MKPSGTPTHGAKRNSQALEPIGTLKVMAQHPCYADSPVMPLPFADIRPHGMNADDGYCCSSWAMTDLSCLKFRYIRHGPIHRILSAEYGLKHGGEYLPVVCVTDEATRTTDVYEPYQTSGIHPQ